MREVRTALRVILAFSFLLGVLYPLVVTGIGQLAFPWRASGSLLSVSGREVGSELIGQQFVSPRYFHGRPSASNYDGRASGASNFGPSNTEYLLQVRNQVAALRARDGLAAETPVPGDLVLASASGLDPEITYEGALVQIERVAAARELDAALLRALVTSMVREPFLGAFGERRVNVLLLNLALDEVP